MAESEKEQHLQDGTILNNRYKILRFLSSGGFGNTYEAEDEEFGAHVAIKELFISGICKRDSDNRQVSISVAENRQLFRKQKEKFRNEAARLRKINHPNVVKVRDEFEENGTAYYVMDFVRGKSLDDMQRSGELNEKRSVQYINQVLAALEAVHNVDILHLDIKPSNVMVDDNNSVVLIDFGASKRVADDDGKSLSLSTGLAGTPGYAPLEQMSGKRELIGKHSDIYAVGATLYKLITGITPPDPNEILIDGLPDFNASTEVKDAIKSAMEVKYTNRPQSIAEFRAILNGGGGGGVTPPPPAPSPQPAPKPGGTISVEEARERERRRRRRMMLVGSLIGVFILAGLLTWLFMSGDIIGGSSDDISSTSADTVQKNDSVLVSETPVVAPVPGVDAVEDVEEIPQNQTDEASESNRPEAIDNTQSTTTTESGNYSSHASSSQRAVIDELLGNMVWVAGGTYTMGATSEQGSDAYSDEKPAHAETVGGFYLCKYEVTQKLWSAVMGSNPSNWKGDNLPVEMVSWDNCQEFINKLNELTNNKYGFRLPTEAEWEYAARGGNRSRGYKYSGSDNVGSVAWYNGNSGSRTHAVGGKSPNELGLYDLSGNVWEWTASKWCDDYNSPRNSSLRVLRGGSWNFNARDCRVSYRYYIDPGIRLYYYGLRLAR